MTTAFSGWREVNLHLPKSTPQHSTRPSLPRSGKDHTDEEKKTLKGKGNWRGTRTRSGSSESTAGWECCRLVLSSAVLSHQHSSLLGRRMRTCKVIEKPVLPSKDVRWPYDGGFRKRISHFLLSHRLNNQKQKAFWDLWQVLGLSPSPLPETITFPRPYFH